MANTINSTILSSGGVWPNQPYNSSTIYATSVSTGSSANFTTSYNRGPTSSNILTINDKSNAEIVRVNLDGTVTWAAGINVDEAAEAFSRSISLGAELHAGLTNSVKRAMRDTVFAEIIAIAKDKGSLSADDLTYFWEAAKIMDKLRGANE